MGISFGTSCGRWVFEVFGDYSIGGRNSWIPENRKSPGGTDAKSSGGGNPVGGEGFQNPGSILYVSRG